MIFGYNTVKYMGKCSLPYQKRRIFTMFCFHKKKKKNTNTIWIIVGVVVGVAAAAVGGYFLFTKVLKDKLCKKKTCECVEECCDEACEAVAEEVVEEVAEAVEE